MFHVFIAFITTSLPDLKGKADTGVSTISFVGNKNVSLEWPALVYFSYKFLKNLVACFKFDIRIRIMI